MRLAQRLERGQRRAAVAAKARALASPIAACPDPGALLDFVPRVSPHFFRPDHLEPLARAAEGGYDKPGSLRICFSVPVRHGKTQLLQHLIAWILARNPRARILYASYAFSFSRKQTGKAREIAKRAGVSLSGARRKDFWETAAGGFCMAAGIGGAITGEGYDWVIVDDPHKNRAEAESRVIREGVVDAFVSDIFTRREPAGTNFLIVHARWHVSDLIGELTSPENKNPFQRVNLRALDDNDRPLEPRLFGAAELKKIREDVGPYVWAGLYDGNPRPRGGALFQDVTQAIINAETAPRKFRIAIGLDLAHTASTQSDHNAAVVMRSDLTADPKRPVLDVIEAYRARGTLTDRTREEQQASGDRTTVVDPGFVNQVARLVTQNPGAVLVMYAKDSESGTIELFERALADKLSLTRPMRVIVLPADRDKFMRSQPYAATWNDGRVRIPGRTSAKQGHDKSDGPDEGRNREGWQHAYSVEHVNFTGRAGEENDQVDAAAAAHDYLCKPTAKVGGVTSGRGNEADRLARIM